MVGHAVVTGQERRLIVIWGSDSRRRADAARVHLSGMFPAGRFHADLHPVAWRPVDLAKVLHRFLTQARIPDRKIPKSLAARRSLWQSYTRGWKLSVHLEDAMTVDQVRALLPGPGPGLVVVATAWPMKELAEDGAVFERV